MQGCLGKEKGPCWLCQETEEGKEDETGFPGDTGYVVARLPKAALRKPRSFGSTRLS